MANNINLSLLKQELYDFSEEEIKIQLEDHTKFMDPALYYRAIEGIFHMMNMNIFVFVPPDEDKNDDFGSLEIPRYKLFHARPKRGKGISIIIFKHLGSESDNLNYPQCELIVDCDQNNNFIRKFFEEKMTDLLYDTMIETSKTISWYIDPITNEPVANVNLYSTFYFRGILGKIPHGQIIDNYGKLRGLVFTYKEEEITVMFPPSQPENLPLIKNEPQRPRIETILSLFNGNIVTAVTTTQDGIDGIWLKLTDIDHGIYCPFLPVNDKQFIEKILGDLPIGPPNPIFTNGKNVINRIKKLRRVLDITLQLIIWIYILSKLDVVVFIKNYFRLGDFGKFNDSSNIYDISNINRRIPKFNSIDQAMDYLGKYIPTLVSQKRFVLYSKKYMDGLIYFIKEYDHTTKGLIRKIPKEIIGLFVEETDFIQHQNVALFIRESDMKAWLFGIKNSEFKNIKIQNKLDISFGLYSEPYLYVSSDKNNNIYIVQNVIGGDMLRALNVSFNWFIKRVNHGYHSFPFENPNNPDQFPVFAIYGISTSSTLIVIKNRTNNESNFLQLLTYGPNQYAALLPIL